MLWSCHIELTAQPVSASRSRDFVRQHLAEHEVSLSAFEQTLLLEVKDASLVRPSSGAAQDFDTNGRGMTIVNLLSRNWGVDAHTDGGKSVWAEFSRL